MQRSIPRSRMRFQPRTAARMWCAEYRADISAPGIAQHKAQQDARNSAIRCATQRAHLCVYTHALTTPRPSLLIAHMATRYHTRRVTPLHSRGSRPLQGAASAHSEALPGADRVAREAPRDGRSPTRGITRLARVSERVVPSPRTRVDRADWCAYGDATEYAPLQALYTRNVSRGAARLEAR